MKGSHRKRVEKVREFASHNKFFSAIAVLLIVFLLFRTVNRNTEQPDKAQEEQTVTEESKTEETGWRFYPIDLVVLGVGGGFCTVMIIRERRKAKEGLN